MKVVIFAAGLGTRLYPYTKNKPKALIEVKGKAMLERTIEKFVTFAQTSFVINIHAFSSLMKEWILNYSMSHPNLNIAISDESDELLETGGGLKKMESLIYDDNSIKKEPFFVHNVDIISDINFNDLLKFDLKKSLKNKNYLATLAVRKCDSDRFLLFNDKGLLCGWENIKTGEQRISRLNEKKLYRFCFTGIHIIHPSLFPLMIESGKFSIIDVYLRLAKDYDIYMYDVSDFKWIDMGSTEKLDELNS